MMNISYKTNKNIGLFIVIAIIFIVLSFFIHHKKIINVTHNLIQMPEAYGENISIKRFNNSGKLIQYLTASKMIHSQINNTITFFKPSAMMFTENQAPWHINADEAFSVDHFKTFELQHHVTMIQHDLQKGTDTIITTSEVKIDTIQQLIQTQQYVKLIQYQGKVVKATIEAKGIEVDQKTNSIKLLAKVKGYYAP